MPTIAPAKGRKPREQRPVRFDPAKIDWQRLVKIYQDDPVLVGIFEAMESWSDLDRGTFRDYWSTSLTGIMTSTGSTTGLSFTIPSSTVTVNATSSGTSSSTNTVTTPLKLSWDTSGKFKLLPET